jgi:hypothetical protein
MQYENFCINVTPANSKKNLYLVKKCKICNVFMITTNCTKTNYEIE